MWRRNKFLYSLLAVLSLLIFTDLIYSFGYYKLITKEKSSHQLYENALKYTFFIVSEDLKGSFENKLKPDGISAGSGFVIKNADEYYLITANHVVEKKSLIYISFNNGKKIYKVKKLGWDRRFDLAVLKFEENIKWPYPAVLGKGLEKIGDEIYILGNPLGFRFFWLKGNLIKAKAYVPGVVTGFLATDAICNPGNSGGPIINNRGEVIGIVDLITTSSNPICMAIPVEILNKLLFPLSVGEVEHGFIGFGAINSWYLTPEMKKKAGLEEKAKEEGVIVVNVAPGSPAYGNLKKGDFLLSYGSDLENSNIPIKDASEFIENLNTSFFLGDEVTIKFRRGKDNFVKKFRLVNPSTFIRPEVSKKKFLSYSIDCPIKGFLFFTFLFLRDLDALEVFWYCRFNLSTFII